MAANPPFVVRLPRQTGQKEVRFAHLLSGEVQMSGLEVEPEVQSEIEPDRIDKLEREVAQLRREFEEFRKKFE